MDSYLPHVGYVQFPRQPADLTSAVCPACFSPRSAQRCPTCGLDLANPAIAELDAASTDASASLDRRLELIGRIRYESSRAAAPAVAPLVAPAAPPAAVAVPAAPAAVPPVATTVAEPTVPSEPRRHLGVQVILLIVGVSLLAVGAIFFLVYAFITFGLVWRSVIIGAVTVASFVGASLLRRRKLGATAEAIAVLAGVFVYLDAFAIRANDLFGAASSDPLVYWGAALLVSAVGFTVWHRFSGLRVPSILGTTTFAPGLALLVGGLGETLDDGVRVFSVLLAVAIGALTHPLAGGRAVERTISLVSAVVGLVSAALVALLVQTSVGWAPIVTLGLVVLVAGAHVALLLRLRVSRPFANLIAGLGSVIAASMLVAVAARMTQPEFAVSVPLIAAAVVALVLELVARRTASPVAIVSAWSAAGVAAIILLVVAGASLVRALVVASYGADRWSRAGGAVLDVRADHVLSIVALLGVITLAGGAWALGGTLRARRFVLVSAGLGVLVLAVPLLGQLWSVVLGWLLLSAAAVALLVVGRRRAWGASIRVALLTTGLVSLALSYSSSWASIDTWWYASVGAVALLVVARAATELVPVRAAVLGAATVLALVAIGSEGWHVNERLEGGSGAGVDALHAVSLLAILLIALAALLSRRLSTIETRVLFWLSLITALVTAGLSWVNRGGAGTPAFPHFLTSIVLGLLLLGALVLWALRRGFTAERLVTSIAVAPAAAWLLDSAVTLADLPPFAQTLAPIVAALLVAAVSLATGGPRWARDAGVGLVAVPAVTLAGLGGAQSTWLVLVLGGVTALILAVSRDGLFGSASPRRYLGWAALALAFGGLAWTLDNRGVRDLEPYVLPLTGALLLVALGAWRAQRTSLAPAVIALGALLVSIVPLGVQSASGALEQSIIVAGISAVLLLVGSVLRGSVYLDVAAAAGAVGVLVAGFGRPVAIAIARDASNADLDIWLALSTVVLVLAAVAQAQRTDIVRRIIAQSAVSLALALVVLIETSALRDDALGAARALAVAGVLATIHVVGMLLEKPPFTRVVAWISLAFATVAGIAGIVVGAVDPFEWATVILAVALLVVGAVLLRRYPDASSWPWLAPGLLVLVLPSLVATFVDQPVWRLVGLGVVCVVAIVVGAVRKLQAPLLIGTIVVLVHAIRTFSPQLVAVYQLTEWWVWAVVGGAVIIFVAVTFERRMRDLRSVGTRIAALR
jgi:hypothetical protein